MNRWNYNDIHIRNISEADFPFLKRLYSFSDVKKYCVAYEGQNIDDLCRDMVKSKSVFIIENMHYESIGYITVGMHPLFGPMFGQTFWLQYAILPPYRNNGFATKAIRFFINELNPNVIALLINDDNYPSIHIAQKCGFTKLDLGVGTKGNGSMTNNESPWVYGISN